MFDTQGNIAIQCSYTDYINSDNAFLGILHAGVNMSGSIIWDVDTLYDLEQISSTTMGEA